MTATGSPGHEGSTAHRGHVPFCRAGGTSTPGFSPSPPLFFSTPLANGDGADTESYEQVWSMELIPTQLRTVKCTLECRRWITAGGSQEKKRETISRVCYMKISRLCEVIPFLGSVTTKFIIRKLQMSAAMQIRCTGGMAPPSKIQSTILRHWMKETHARLTKVNYNAEYDTRCDPD